MNNEAVSFIIQLMTFIGAIAGLVTGIMKFTNFIHRRKFPSKTLYGKEADNSYHSIKAKLGEPFSDEEYGGGNKLIPQLEVKPNRYDSQTMGDEWKAITRIVRYYYENDNSTIMVKTWRLK